MISYIRTRLEMIGTVFAVIAVGFILGGIWTRWLLAERLFQTGTVFAVLSVLAVLYVVGGNKRPRE